MLKALRSLPEITYVKLATISLFLLLTHCSDDQQGQQGQQEIQSENGENYEDQQSNNQLENGNQNQEFDDSQFNNDQMGEDNSGESLNSNPINEFAQNSQELNAGFNNQGFNDQTANGGGDDNMMTNQGQNFAQNNFAQQQGQNDLLLNNNQGNFAENATQNQSDAMVTQSAPMNNMGGEPAPGADYVDPGASQTAPIPSVGSGGQVLYVTANGSQLYRQAGSDPIKALEQGDHPLVYQENEWGKTSQGYYIPLSDLSSSPIGRKRGVASWR